MKIAGLDIGITKDNPIGYALIDHNGARFSLVRLVVITPDMKLEWEQRIAALFNSVLGFVDDDKPAIYGFERAAAHTNMQSGLKLAEMGGTIRAIGALFGAPVYGVEPSQAKKALTTYGAASKTDMMECVKELFGAHILDRLGPLAPHGADAIGVAVAAFALYAGVLAQPKKKATRRKAA